MNVRVDDLFPEIDKTVIDGTLSIESAKDLMVSIALEEYPHLDTVVGFGSSVNGRFKSMSDLDILVISEEGRAWEKKTIVRGGFPSDIQKVSRSGIEQAFVFARKSSSPLMIEPFLYGSFLYGDKNLFDEFKAAAINLFKQGADLIDDNSLTKLKSSIFFCFIEIYSSNNQEEIISLALSAFNSIISMVNIMDSRWCYSGKFSLGRVSENRKNCLKKSYIDLVNGNKDTILYFLRGIIDEIGSPFLEERISVYLP